MQDLKFTIIQKRNSTGKKLINKNKIIYYIGFNNIMLKVKLNLSYLWKLMSSFDLQEYILINGQLAVVKSQQSKALHLK